MERDTFELTALKILLYLYENKEAKDPIEHVVEYWIRRRDEEYIATQVSDVLDRLLDKGVVVKGGRVPIYKLNPSMSSGLSTFINVLRPFSG